MNQNSLTNLVAAARQRSILNLVAEQAAAGLIAALAGFLILLLAGSDALSWGWLIVLFGGGAAFSAWRTWRGLPSVYEVAQAIDRRLNLKDTLSTAIAFTERPAWAKESVWRAQRETAESTSAGLTAAAAVPLEMPRRARWLGLLLVATLGLMAVRLGMLGTLDLRQPLVAGLSDYLPSPAANSPAALLAQKKGVKSGGEEQSEEQGKPEEEQQDPAQSDMPQPPQMDSSQQQQGDPQTGQNNQPQDGDEQSQGSQDEQQEASNDGGDSQSKDGDSKSGQNESESDQQQEASNQNNGNNDKQSLMDKVRDSLANLMSKLQPQKNNTQRQQQSQNQKGDQDQQQDQQQSDQQGQGDQQSQQSAEQQQQGDPSKQANANQDQKSNQESNQKSASNDPKTGYGKQDGSKEIKQAQQQLEAMGKITELIGQRSQTVTGEIMLERKSSQQHDLKTAFNERDATHSENGSRLQRDEIPVELQPYIERYFTKVRQTPVPARAAPKQ